MTDVPDWAIDKALYLMGEGGLSARDMVGAYASTTLKTRAYAFARYIAKHEQPPVDPLQECLRETYGAAAPEFVAAFRAALKSRGLSIVELARTKSEAGE